MVPTALGKTMRTIIALVFALLSGSSLADTVRRPSVPERLWGRWAPSTGACRDDKAAIVLSAKAYATSEVSCAVQWVTETPGARGPVYSAQMQCSSPGMAERKTQSNLIFLSNDSGQLSVGPDFRNLKLYQRCPAD
jgi:hypothetical protein